VATVGERSTDEALKAIAEPRRRAILRLVADEELAAGEIAAAFEVTRTAVSQHLTVLKQAGLLTERRDGTRRLYRARPEGLAGLREFLAEMWASSLDAARQIVEAERGISDEDHAASADRPAAGRGLRAARRLCQRRLLGRLGPHPGPVRRCLCPWFRCPWFGCPWFGCPWFRCPWFEWR